MHGLVIAGASLVGHGVWGTRGLSRCYVQALEDKLSSYGTWDLHGPGIKPVSPALTG